ncbi:BspA family leucine-rich repeat surface protein [Planktomarina temperata]|uniref:BspA family leucine-rich repeat surface protein n=1 Tax=Planktomarina temperata TaxID=1284658 RepID=UPI0035C86B5D
MRYFLAIAQTATALFFRRLCALLSLCIISIFLSISSASAQFLSDGTTPVTPIPSNAAFGGAITACLAESAITGICPLYGDSSGYGDIENWDTSLVTNMNSAFLSQNNFNGDISGWNTSAVTDMSFMFSRASAFDQEIRGWDVTSVTNFTDMFNGATAFAAQNAGRSNSRSNIGSKAFPPHKDRRPREHNPWGANLRSGSMDLSCLHLI